MRNKTISDSDNIKDVNCQALAQNHSSWLKCRLAKECTANSTDFKVESRKLMC